MPHRIIGREETVAWLQVLNLNVLDHARVVLLAYTQLCCLSIEQGNKDRALILDSLVYTQGS